MPCLVLQACEDALSAAPWTFLDECGLSVDSFTALELEWLHTVNTSTLFSPAAWFAISKRLHRTATERTGLLHADQRFPSDRAVYVKVPGVYSSQVWDIGGPTRFNVTVREGKLIAHSNSGSTTTVTARAILYTAAWEEWEPGNLQLVHGKGGFAVQVPNRVAIVRLQVLVDQPHVRGQVTLAPVVVSDASEDDDE